MRFELTSDQQLFGEAVRDLLARECAPGVVRAAWDAPDDAPLTVWPHLAKMGVIGMTAPERWGGLGLDALDWVAVLEEAGRAALPDPLLETTAVAIPLLDQVAGDAAKDRWLGAAAAGRALVTVGLAGAPLVVDGRRAHLILLEHGDELHAIERGGATLHPQASVDGARKLCRVEWTPTAQTRIAGDARAALDAAFDRGALAAAAQLIGVARRLLEVTVGYAKDRTQFGRKIGSFQAIKHQLADAHAAVELARPCVLRAAHAVAHREPERAIEVSLAKAFASEAALRAARTALQCHGAIGYSFEYDLHLWMKRAWALAAAWGDASWHRRRIATAVLDGDLRGD